MCFHTSNFSSLNVPFITQTSLSTALPAFVDSLMVMVIVMVMLIADAGADTDADANADADR